MNDEQNKQCLRHWAALTLARCEELKLMGASAAAGTLKSVAEWIRQQTDPIPPTPPAGAAEGAGK